MQDNTIEIQPIRQDAVKLISIIIPTIGRDGLYPLIQALIEQHCQIPIEIILIAQVPLRESALAHEQVRIFYEQAGKGYAYYRNCGCARSAGEILVFIDDDEMPMNPDWLALIVEPIRQGSEQVVTAGVHIPLGQGYMTDCISLLGFPGGGASGFQTMWEVDDNGYTLHLCTGNLAIARTVMTHVDQFSNRFKMGNEDVDLADKLTASGIRIKYLQAATLLHAARKGYLNFIRWNMERGHSAAAYLQHQKSQQKVRQRFSVSLRILSRCLPSHYFFGVLWMQINQYLWQGLGFLLQALKHKRKKASGCT